MTFQMADLEKLYMQSSLVLWVETFTANDGHPLECQDLFDGVFLNDVMQQIDTRSAYDNVNRCVEDVSVRLHNWDILVKNIRGFYSDVLQQLLVMRLPNISIICRDQGKETSFAEVRKALLLILGCAVQCEQKETFIDKIMSMDITAQTEIVDNIKEATDDCETILPIQRPEMPASSSSYMDKMFHHLYRLIRERDEFAKLAAELGQDRDYYMSQAEGRLIADAPQISPDRHHVALELAECKANLRHLRQELEDRQESLSDLKDELHESLSVCAQLKNENALLVQEVRATRLLRDELDIMKEKASKVDMYEKEILKYKERLNEFEFYKARTSELKEDNAILEETKVMLEDQLTNSRKRIETVAELESELGNYRQQIEELSKDRDSDREKIEYLTQHNARLEFQRKTSMNESASLETELSAARSRIGDISHSLSEQLSETSHTRILRLELENQRLVATLTEVKKNALAQSAEISLELEKENQRLFKKLEKLQSSECKSSEQVIEMESELFNTREERDRLLTALDIANEKSEQHVHDLETEIEQLSQALHQLRERSEKSSDLKVKDLERENKRLHETVGAKNSQLNKLELENRQLQLSSHHLKELRHRVQELEQENQFLEKENADLHQKVATLQHTSDKLEVIEQENSDMSVDVRKLQKTVETLQAALQKKEHLEQDHISLTLEHHRSQRMMETLKAGSDRALELESENDGLNKELQQLRKLVDSQKTQKLKQDQMEFEIIDMGNENQRLQKSLEVTMRRLRQLEEDNMDIETDNEKLTKDLDTLRVTVKRLENRDTEASQLEVEVQCLQKDKAVLEKENRKLKKISELKDSSLDDVNAKFMSLNQECRCLRQAVEKMKETCYKVKDLEKENKEFMQELNIDRRTLAALREDLVNEKIRSQELSNELDQLTSELEKVGIDTEKLTMAEQTKDANHFKALETMIEETLKKSSELKEEKIRALETRLEESKSRNLKLQEDLIGARREKEVLKQRLEEEELVVNDVVVGKRSENESNVKSASPSATKDIFQLKDHLVDLERQNATLLAETDNLRSNNQNMIEQCHKLDSQLANLHSQHATLQGYYSSLQEQNAKLQVEYTTLQAQISSALSQQGMLKNQLSNFEGAHERLTHKNEHLQSNHQSLVTDHETLQNLHDQLTSEYESLVSEHASLKSLQKSLKLEMKDLQDQIEVLLQGKDDVNKLQNELEIERDRMKREVMSLGHLRSDHQVLNEDHNRLRSAFDKLSNDYSNVLASHKQVKTEYNNLQLDTTELQVELTEARENIAVADMEFEKLENKMEAIYHINERIENENQALLMQIKQLLCQNQELLTQVLNSKDHFAEEEKAYLEKLSELRWQKERLEEKIMEHYKNRLSPKKKGLGALIARKARGIMSKGPRHSKSRSNFSELFDNSSQGSGSTEPPNDVHQALGAKSSEDVNASAHTDSIGQPGTIGLGHAPTMSDVEPSPADRTNVPMLGSNNIHGRSSSVFEVLAMKEASKSTLNAADSNFSDDSCADELSALEQFHHHLSKESESRGSSGHSSTSSGRVQHQWQPHWQSFQDGMHQIRPDVSMMSQTVSELHASEISAHSVGSDNENIIINSNGLLSHQVSTSTPRQDSEVSPVIKHSNLDSHSSSSRVGDRSLKHLLTGGGDLNIPQKRLSENNQRNSRHETLSYGSTTLGYEQNSFLGYQTSDNLPSVNSTSFPMLHRPVSHAPHYHQSTRTKQGKEQRPAPTHPPSPIPATEKFDHLTISVSAGDKPPSVHYSQPYGQSLSDADHLDHNHYRDGQNPSNNTDNQISLCLDRKRSSIIKEQASQGLITKLNYPLTQSHTGICTSNQLQRVDSSVVCSQSATGSHSSPFHHVRPASAIGQSSHVRGVYSRPPDELRSRQKPDHGDSGGHLQAAHNVNNSNSKYSQPYVTERPKSVPPHLFYRSEDRHGCQERDLSASPTHRTRDGVEPVSRGILREAPNGRDPREIQSYSNIGLSREPVASSFQSATQSLRHSYLPPSLSHHQQQHHSYESNIDHASLNRQIGNCSSSSSQVPPLYLCSNNQASTRPDFMDQPSLYKLDSPSLVHQNLTRSGQQQSRQGQDPDKLRAAPNQSSFLHRSQSSMGNVSRTTPPTGLNPGLSYGKSNTLRRWKSPPSSQNKDSMNEEHDRHHRRYPIESFSDFHTSPHGVDKQHRVNGEPREIPTSCLTESYPYHQRQQLSSGTNNPSLTSNPPPQHNRSQSSSHHLKGNDSSNSNLISREPGSQFDGSQSRHTSHPQHEFDGSQKHHTSHPQHEFDVSMSQSISHQQHEFDGSQPRHTSHPQHEFDGSQPRHTSHPQDEFDESLPHQISHHQHIRSQGKLSSNYQYNIVPSTIPGPGELISSDSPIDIHPPHIKTSQVSPQSKALQLPPKSEKEVEGEQAASTNSIWYEYGCV